MNADPKEYLEFIGNLSSIPSYPEYTRLIEVGPAGRFVEFVTASAENPQSLPLSQLVNQQVILYVPRSAPLFFSDDPVPPPVAGLTLGDAGFHDITPPGPTPTGMVGLDGSAVTLKHEGGKGPGLVNGLTSTAKDGTVYDLTMTAVSLQAPGRTGALANWMVSRATFTITSKTAPPVAVVLGFSYCPSNLIATLFLLHGNVSSVINIDLKGLVFDATNAMVGSAQLTRNILYYGTTYSTQSLPMQATDNGPGMYLATSPVWRNLLAIEYFTPALAQVIAQIAFPPLTQPTPLAALGAIAPTLTETQEQYVSGSSALAASAIPLLLASLTQSFVSGMSDAVRWVGWMLAGGIGRDAFETVLTQAYTDNQQWAYTHDENQPSQASMGAWKDGNGEVGNNSEDKLPK